MGGTNPAWWIALGTGVLFVVVDFLLPSKGKKKAGWILLPVGILCVGVGVVGLAHDYRANESPVKANGPSQETPPPKDSAKKPEAKGQKQTATGKHTQQQQQQQKNSGGTNSQESISTGDIATGPCSNVQVGGSNNQATAICGMPSKSYNYDCTEERNDKPGHFESVGIARCQEFTDMSSALQNALRNKNWDSLSSSTKRAMDNHPGWPTPHLFAALLALHNSDLTLARAEQRKAMDFVDLLNDQLASTYNRPLGHLNDEITDAEQGKSNPYK